MADTKITGLGELATTPASNDVLPVVDISDTTMAASGTTKKIQVSNLLASKQDADADLGAIAALAPSDDDFIQRKASAWANRTVAQVKTDLGLAGSNTGDQTITLTGDVTGSGTGSFAATIANDAVTFAKVQNIATDRLLGRDTAGSGDAEELAVTNGLEFTGSTSVGMTAAQRTVGLSIVIDGGGSAITTGVKGFLEIPFAMTVTGWTILADQSGSIVLDIWKDTYANFPPTVADTIAGSEKPTLSTAQKNQDLTLSTWTTTISAGDILGFNVDSAATVTRVSLTIRGTKT